MLVTKHFWVHSRCVHSADFLLLCTFGWLSSLVFGIKLTLTLLYVKFHAFCDLCLKKYLFVNFWLKLTLLPLMSSLLLNYFVLKTNINQTFITLVPHSSFQTTHPKSKNINAVYFSDQKVHESWQKNKNIDNPTIFFIKRHMC